MQINVSWPFSFLFLLVCFFLLLASSFFLALLLRCHVTNSSREVCSFHPLSLSPLSPFLRVCLCCQATLIQKYFGRWHLKCHIYMAFLCGPMSATSPDFLYSLPSPSPFCACCLLWHFKTRHLSPHISTQWPRIKVTHVLKYNDTSMG